MGSTVFFAMGDDFHFAPRAGQKLVIFRALFSGTGLHGRSVLYKTHGDGGIAARTVNGPIVLKLPPSESR